MIVKDYEDPMVYYLQNNYYEEKALKLINSNNKSLTYYDLYQIAERGLENEAHINRNSVIYFNNFNILCSKISFQKTVK